MSGRDREAALAELVGGLLDARRDPALERFDAELAAAEADGRIDPRTARVLRWWQREGQRALVEHAKATLPAALLAMERSAAAAARDVDEAARSWDRAEASSEQPGVAQGTQQGTQPGTQPPPGPAAHAALTVPASPPYSGPTAPRRLLVAGLNPIADSAPPDRAASSE